ncbi:hypothetical protein P168DRAFT_40173 [Aspergillus campestris IBT 28561]|uniref:Secreted protein n=1 Tax=Aspergillus campestris (strain IBT 28561) TaxID=1392248 RepID=A0A2I1CWP7_ASPC2|nr:uncharacterized protein P168DRAFT_40173 [Aspergillus campestris IBT 28561]PKY02040.1 hypothetical protein P168DRAFT_40173 [Aspergillus campestris IBT 28561]
MDPAATRTYSLCLFLSLSLSLCVSPRFLPTYHLTNASPPPTSPYLSRRVVLWGPVSPRRLPPHSQTGYRRRIEGTRIRRWIPAGDEESLDRNG